MLSHVIHIDVVIWQLLTPTTVARVWRLAASVCVCVILYVCVCLPDKIKPAEITTTKLAQG